MLRIVPHTVPLVGRSYDHFPDGFELHLLPLSRCWRRRLRARRMARSVVLSYLDSNKWLALSLSLSPHLSLSLTHTHTHTHTTHSLSPTHSHTLSFTHSLTHPLFHPLTHTHPLSGAAAAGEGAGQGGWLSREQEGADRGVGEQPGSGDAGSGETGETEESGGTGDTGGLPRRGHSPKWSGH